MENINKALRYLSKYIMNAKNIRRNREDRGIMKILMLSCEYPPKNVGGLSNHVYFLSHQLSKIGHEVHVITCVEGIAALYENDDGVKVHRVHPYNIDTEDFIKWVMHLNYSMIEEASKLIRSAGRFDIIHAHDWLAAYSARAIKLSFSIPMVCTIHATEYGRNKGIRTEMQKYISSVEWMLTYEAWKVVVCSDHMKQEVNSVLGAAWEKIWVIPNGIDINCFEFSFDWLSFRRGFAFDNEKIIFYVGRHVFEKGIHLLVEAAHKIISEYNDVKFVIAGAGPMTEEMKNRVRDMGVENKFVFPGYIDLGTKNKLYKVANVAVFPSLYEPFGIVAIEAMAAECPVVVSDVGGLSEIINHRENGLKMISDSANSLADNVVEILKDEGLSNFMKNNAKNTVKERYTWIKIADITAEMYNMVKLESRGTEWE